MSASPPEALQCVSEASLYSVENTWLVSIDATTSGIKKYKADRARQKWH